MRPIPPWISAPTARASARSKQRSGTAASYIGSGGHGEENEVPPQRRRRRLTNGIFGGGGGIPLLVLLTKWAGVEEKKAFATCVAVIFPMCAVSAALWYWRAELSLLTALPYLLGGFAGGLVGGRLFKKVPGLWLRRIFALFLLYGGWRYLFTGG